MRAWTAASFSRAAASVTITVGLGTPEYGIWPVSFTLLKKAKSR